jgi:hypothetical protein
MRSLKTCRCKQSRIVKDKEGENQVGMGAAAPVKSSNVSAGAQVQKRFISPYAVSR